MSHEWLQEADATTPRYLKHVEMYRMQGVLVLLVLHIGLAHSFFWDIIVGEKNQLKFYYYGILMNTEELPADTDVTAITYDPVHYKVLFSGFHTNTIVSIFDLSTKKIEPILTNFREETNLDYFTKMAYDPFRQLLFGSKYYNIYSFSLTSESFNKAVDGNTSIIVTVDFEINDIALDSCGGFIYWVTDNNIERAAFDGSEREVLLESTVNYRRSLAIDQQMHKMYWTEIIETSNGRLLLIESADWNGKNRKTLYFTKNEQHATSLIISKDYLYWKSFTQETILQLLKNPPHDAVPKFYSNASQHFWDCKLTAANYTIKELTEGTTNCKDLKSLIPNSSVPTSSGTKLSEECRSEYTQNCTDEGCNVSSCQNYCLQGNCSVDAEGQPQCSCEAGYSGERCDVNVCYNYCLYNGVCSLNEEDEPFCECTADYGGARCDVPTTNTGVYIDNTTLQILRDLYSALKQLIKL